MTIMPKILIVEDEMSAQELEKSLLELENINTISVDNGNDALRLIKLEKPALVVLDIMLPDMSGLEIYDTLRKDPETKKLKIIFVTVLAKTEITREFDDDKYVLGYLTKPFNNQDFISAIKKGLKD